MESLSLIFEKTWQPGAITSDWIKGNIIPILNKNDPGNYQPVNLTYVPGDITEEIVLEDVSKNMKGREVNTDSQHGFTKGKSYLTISAALCERMG